MNAAKGKNAKTYTDYTKRGKNPTTNAKGDSHKKFCARCLEKHGNHCPNGNMRSCDL